ncbi:MULTISPECIES: PilN domain-containing protein [unclassified Marinovum]
MSGSTLGRALGWWSDGLRHGLPEWLSSLLFGPRSTLVLKTSDTRAQLMLDSGTEQVELFDEPVIAAQDDAAPKIARSRAVRRARSIDAGEVVLQLPRHQVLKTRIDLPARAAINLHGEIEKDINRYTPFNPKDVYFDARVDNVEAEGETIKVVMLIAQVADVTRLVALARSIGLRPTRVTDDASDPQLNLLPPLQRHRPKRILPRLIQGTALLLVVALMALAGLEYTGRQAALEQTRAETRELRRGAQGAAAMEQRLEALRTAASLVETRKAESASVGAALETVTASLTDTDYLASFDLAQGVISMAGYSKDPTAMLLLLDKNPALENARFTAPTTRDERTGRQRFFVSVDLVRTGGGE